MSEHHSHTTEGHEHEEHAGLTKSKIWQVFGILLLITVIEFIIALVVLPKGYMSHGVGNFVYIALTLVKAFYIVAYFMHLKYEKLGLQLSLTVSFIFIIYFIVLMLIEGGFLNLHMLSH
ncbi:MAG: cytochrome C oxidase subunit IV family protein [Pedobacter agri]|jgi:cytochrome c oxidase subunit 4|uniref:Cytochrome C oxidase subunit IV family protein n=1 Tax=Pedobacter agri TaxID=454586 RepID=A0A9X3IAA5_9SPHI|nr:cytochrome C oxidase subunit IV family protein [Pedobacter agri]MCX3265844.1 cytochrome C oxidase subunit IV family protein [Pedobacter agri]MDQ1140254.1 cytochrome c oxidase subunit 4 [Pedobacter agri]RZJ64808.1 MAG: caa(3)-type oxidase [Flavobacterium sp.]